MKLGKRKFTGIIAISLAAVALTSVGFAAWTINASDVKDEGNTVTVTTGKLTDNRFTFNAAIDSTDNSVAFDSVEGSGGTIISGTASEDLTFKVKANIKGSNLTTSVDGIYIYFVDTESKYAGMISNGLIQSPIAFGSDSEVEIIDGTELTAGDLVEGEKYGNPASVSKYTYQIKNGSDSSLDIDFTFTFAWGSAFNNQNPTTAINSAGAGANEMINKLKTLTSDYANPKLEVVVTAKAKTASA